MTHTALAAESEDGESDPSDAALVELLGHRFGDGLVWLGDDEGDVFARAVHLGLVTGDGYLTCAGRSLLARHRRD